MTRNLPRKVKIAIVYNNNMILNPMGRTNLQKRKWAESLVAFEFFERRQFQLLSSRPWSWNSLQSRKSKIRNACYAHLAGRGRNDRSGFRPERTLGLNSGGSTTSIQMDPTITVVKSNGHSLTKWSAGPAEAFGVKTWRSTLPKTYARTSSAFEEYQQLANTPSAISHDKRWLMVTHGAREKPPGVVMAGEANQAVFRFWHHHLNLL